MSIRLIKAEVSEENAIYFDPKMITESGLSNKAFVVYGILLGLAGKDITKIELSKMAGCSERSLYRAIRELKDLDYYYEDKSTNTSYVGDTIMSASELYRKEVKANV